MTKCILALLLFMQIGCSDVATYVIATAGSFSGKLLYDVIKDEEEYVGNSTHDREEETKKN
jgi:hypothetical protein|tara:strand:+ start:164 stop:346 length:183 start_codon:yes stop_codon:yes gene_type:complete